MRKLIAFAVTVVMLLSSLAFAVPVLAAMVSPGDFTSWGNSPSPEWTYSFQRVSVMINNPNLYLNNAIIPVDPANPAATPVLVEGVVYLPLSAAKVALGAGVVWDVTDETIIATSGTRTATLTIGTDVIVDEGVLYLPIQAVATALNNASVGWEPVSQVMVITTGATVSQSRVAHSAMNSQSEQWYGSTESFRLAENLLLFQRNSGGWMKDTDFGVTMTEQLRTTLLNSKGNLDATTDNGATMPEIRFMIRMYQATKIERFKDSFTRGLNAVLGAQYATGGFSQEISQPSTYNGEITFNDNAMTNIQNFWMDFYNNRSNYYSVDDAMVERIEDSMIRGIGCILNAQIYSKTQDMLTAWCAQHDRDTLVPTWAREYEPPSISGSESVGVLRFLMNLDRDFLISLDTTGMEDIFGDQSVWERVQTAIHAGVAFFAKAEIFGYQHISAPSPYGWGTDRMLIENPTARGLWARFIDIETFDPLFVDRPGPGLGSDTIQWRVDPDERLTYGEINTGFMIEWKHAPAFEGEPKGGNLRNIYNEDGTMDLIASYAALGYGRRTGYQYIGNYGNVLPGLYTAWLARNDFPIPVTNIEGISEMAAVGEIELNGVVVPSSSVQRDIVWEIVDAGTTGAVINGNILTTTAVGTVKIKATIAGGNADGTAFTKEFVIDIKSKIPVSNIRGVPAFLPIGSYNFNKIAVDPAAVQNRDIVWDVADAGTTGAAFGDDGFLTTTAGGKAVVRATIVDGIDTDEDYVKTFEITIHPDPTIVVPVSNIPEDALISGWRVVRYNITNGNRDVSYGKNFGIGSKLFGDRANANTFNVSALPAFLAGLDWIQTSNDARNGIASSQMVFTVNQDMIIYLGVEMRTDMNTIGWVDGTWEFLGTDTYFRNSENQSGVDKFVGLANSGTGKHYLYKRTFSAGDVVRLGAMNQGTSVGNMTLLFDTGVDVTVDFDYNGGTGSVESKAAVVNEAYGELPEATRESYVFLGWSTDGTAEGIVTAESIVKAGGTLTAVWGEDFADGKVRVSLSGPAVLTVMDEAQYILSVANVKNLATVTVWFEVDGTYLNGRDASALNGFDTIGGVQWVNTEGSTWVGRVTLGNMGHSLTASEYTDILSMNFGLKELGETTVKVTKVTLSGYDEAGGAVFAEALIRNGSVDTRIIEWFSPYDVNKDGSVDQLDLTTAQKYFRATEGDPTWDDAKAADVDGDGLVDINDFILILNHIVW